MSEREDRLNWLASRYAADVAARKRRERSAPSPEALDLTVGERHGGRGRLLTEAEIREREAQTGHRL